MTVGQQLLSGHNAKKLLTLPADILHVGFKREVATGVVAPLPHSLGLGYFSNIVTIAL